MNKYENPTIFWIKNNKKLKIKMKNGPETPTKQNYNFFLKVIKWKKYQWREYS